MNGFSKRSRRREKEKIIVSIKNKTLRVAGFYLSRSRINLPTAFYNSFILRSQQNTHVFRRLRVLPSRVRPFQSQEIFR